MQTRLAVLHRHLRPSRDSDSPRRKESAAQVVRHSEPTPRLTLSTPTPGLLRRSLSDLFLLFLASPKKSGSNENINTDLWYSSGQYPRTVPEISIDVFSRQLIKKNSFPFFDFPNPFLFSKISWYMRPRS